MNRHDKWHQFVLTQPLTPFQTIDAQLSKTAVEIYFWWVNRLFMELIDFILQISEKYNKLYLCSNRFRVAVALLLSSKTLRPTFGCYAPQKSFSSYPRLNVLSYFYSWTQKVLLAGSSEQGGTYGNTQTVEVSEDGEEEEEEDHADYEYGCLSACTHT